MRTCLPAALLVLFCPCSLPAAGHVYNENFSVLTPAEPSPEAAQAFAQSVLEQAESYRRQVARQWLGQELPPSVGRTFINVSFSATQDVGLTWAIDSPRRTEHTLYLCTSPERALGSTLAHEIVHVVLATRFPDPHRLPAWLEEGIASRYDDPARVRKRQAILRWFEQTGNWPRLENVVYAERIRAEDQAAYAAASSLTSFLLSRAGRETLLQFGQSVVASDLETALSRHYNIRSVDDLQQAWQAWMRSGGR